MYQISAFGVNMKLYVAGFLFNETRDQVVLIKKNRPDWQKGRLNGIGGHVEPGESVRNAMSREFSEEAGMFIAPSSWNEIVQLNVGTVAQIHFFWAIGDVRLVRSTTDEVVDVHPVRALPETSHRNLRWLIPMCLDTDLQFPIKIIDNAVHKC